MARYSGRDWRSPGDQWVRTASGWKRRLDVCKEPDTGDSRTVPDAPVIWQATGSPPTSAASLAQLTQQQIRELLYQKCVLVQQSSRESNHYATLSEAVEKLSFIHAIQDEQCFAFVCKVVRLLYEHCYWTLNGSMQNTLFTIMVIARDKVLSVPNSQREHAELLFSTVTKAVASLEKVYELDEEKKQHLVRRTEEKLKTLRRMKEELLRVSVMQDQLQGVTVVGTGCSDLGVLTDDCLRCIVSYLTHPRDVLNLGMANHKLHALTEESRVWRQLHRKHYGKDNVSDVPVSQENWKELFVTKYLASKEKFRGPDVLILCKFCHIIFWKNYGHPCYFNPIFINEGPPQEIVTPQQFVTLFEW